MPLQFEIVPATLADAPEIAAIYAHHVLHGTATFEIAPPDAVEMAARIGKLLGSGWPWLTARVPEQEGEVLGYAYAAQFRDRAAYRYCCENSIYIRADMLGRGIGTALLAALLKACEASGFRQIIAGIAGTEEASVRLHARAGFTECARLRSVGRKHGQWIDVIYMQRALGAGDGAPPQQEPA